MCINRFPGKTTIFNKTENFSRRISEIRYIYSKNSDFKLVYVDLFFFFMIVI